MSHFKPKRIIIWVVVGLIFVAIVFAMRPQPIPADMVEIGTGPLMVTIEEEGETRVKERFVISSPLDGTILRIEHEPGDPVVMNNTVLAMIQPKAPAFLDARLKAEARAREKAAEAALGRAKADRSKVLAEKKFAESEYVRYQSLGDIVSRERLADVKLRAEASAEQLKAAQFAVRNAEYELAVVRATLADPGAGESSDPIKIYSPVDGVVLKRHHESETMVTAGEPLVEVADPSKLEIVSDLLSKDAVKTKKGDKVLIDRWGGPEVLIGTVKTIEPYGFTKVSALGVEEQRVNIIIDFPEDDTAWQAMGHGYRVEVGIVIWEKDNVLRVPGSAMFRNGEDWAVFCIDNGVASLRKLKIGNRNSFYAEVLEGLTVGEKVITHPSDLIEDGTRVADREVAK